MVVNLWSCQLFIFFFSFSVAVTCYPTSSILFLYWWLTFAKLSFSWVSWFWSDEIANHAKYRSCLMNLIWVADFVTLALNTKKEYTVSYPSCLSRCLLMFMIYFRGHLKSPWSRRKRKRALAPQQWRSFFTPEGKLRDGGIKFLKKVRSGVSFWPTLIF